MKTKSTHHCNWMRYLFDELQDREKILTARDARFEWRTNGVDNTRKGRKGRERAWGSRFTLSLDIALKSALLLYPMEGKGSFASRFSSRFSSSLRAINIQFVPWSVRVGRSFVLVLHPALICLTRGLVFSHLAHQWETWKETSSTRVSSWTRSLDRFVSSSEASSWVCVTCADFFACLSPGHSLNRVLVRDDVKVLPCCTSHSLGYEREWKDKHEAALE